LPRILGVLLAIAGVGYSTYLWPPLANYLYPYNLALGVGELVLGLWLLVFGVNVERWKEQARATRGSWLPHGDAISAAGIAGQLAGCGLALWARRQLGANWSGSVQLKEGHPLVRSGPYKLLRHPIYAGVSLAVLGTTIVGGRVQNLLAVPLMLAAYLR